MAAARDLRLQALIILLVVLSHAASASRVLLFGTVGARSHQFVLLRVGQELATRGHKITLLLSSEEGLNRQELGHRAFRGLDIVTFDGPMGIGTKEWFANQPTDVTEAMARFQADQLAIAEHIYADNTTLSRLRQKEFDVFLKDAWYWPADFLQSLLSVPAIDVAGFAVGMPMLEASLSVPDPVAYLPQVGTALTCNMSFLQRVQNYLQACLIHIFVNRASDSNIRHLVAKTGQRIQSFDLGRTAAVAAIFSADWAIEYPFPVPPKVQLVGPILAEPAKDLPNHLSTFLEQGSAKNQGAVYVSMGSAARLAEAQLHSMAQGLSALSNPVFWKLSREDLPGNTTMESLHLGSNIKVVDWAPQNDILGHPAVKAFVTHAGSNGLYEAAYHGKPVVSVPLMNEQPDNAAKAVYHGFGVTVLPSQLNPINKEPITAALLRVLKEPSYLKNAQKVQIRLMNPRTPAQRAADVVEHVIATGGEDYLETKQSQLYWWQLALLDVKLTLALGIGSIAAVFCYIGKLLYFAAQSAAHHIQGSNRAQLQQRQKQL